MSGYNYSYKIFRKYVVDIFEFYEETNFTRVFIYRKNSVGKDLVEIMDFPSNTERGDILNKAAEFIRALENLLNPLKGRKTPTKISEKTMDDL